MSYFGSTEWFQKVAEGAVPGYFLDGRWGRNASVGSTFEPIISATMAGVIWTPTVASTLQVRLGGNANDDAAGTGARTIKLTGLDENFAIVEEFVTLAGAAASAPTTNTFIRVHRANVETTGTYGGANAGEIIIEDTATSSAVLVIEDYSGGVGRSLFCAFSAPTNHTVWLLGVYYTADTTKSNDFRFLIHDDIENIAAPFSPTRVLLEFEGFKEDIQAHLYAPVKLAGDGDFTARDLWIEGRVDSGTSPVSAGLHFLLKDESV